MAGGWFSWVEWLGSLLDRLIGLPLIQLWLAGWALAWCAAWLAEAVDWDWLEGH